MTRKQLTPQEKLIEEQAEFLYYFVGNQPETWDETIVKDKFRDYASQNLKQVFAGRCYLIDTNENIPELYPEVFAEGMRLPDINELQRYRNVLNWAKHELGWRPVIEIKVEAKE
jgi:hypothetical protein